MVITRTGAAIRCVVERQVADVRHYLKRESTALNENFITILRGVKSLGLNMIGEIAELPLLPGSPLGGCDDGHRSRKLNLPDGLYRVDCRR